MGWFGDAWDWVKGAAKKVGDFVTEGAKKVGEFVAPVLKPIGGFAKSIMNSPVGGLLGNVPIVGSALKVAGNLGNITDAAEKLGKGDVLGGAKDIARIAAPSWAKMLM